MAGYTQTTRLLASFMAESSWKLNVNEFNGEHSVGHLLFNEKTIKPFTAEGHLIEKIPPGSLVSFHGVRENAL